MPSVAISKPRLRCAIIAALAGLTLLLSGCSAVRLGYDQAPTLAYWWLDAYADFNDLQNPRVRNALADWFAWHRRTQLPDYAQLLVRAQADARTNLTPEHACAWWSDVQPRIDTALDRLLPSAAELALTLTPQQIDHIEKRYARGNDDYRGEYLQADPKDRLARSTARAIERAEMLYGRLDDAQRQLIAQFTRESPFDPELWLAERQQRQQDLLRILRRLTADRASAVQAQAALRGYLERVNHSPRDGYRRYAERLIAYNCGFVASVHNSTTPAQRQAAVQKLKGWEGDFRALTADAAGP